MTQGDGSSSAGGGPAPLFWLYVSAPLIGVSIAVVEWRLLGRVIDLLPQIIASLARLGP